MERKQNPVETFLAYLAADRGYSPLTIDYYGRVLQAFEAYFVSLDEGLNWETLDGDVVRRWMEHRMGTSLSPRSMRRDLSVLRSFYRYLLMVGHVGRNPLQLIRNPKVGRTLPSFVKQSEMDRLFDGVCFPDTFEGRRDRLILLTFYTTGLRLSELTGLEWKDIDVGNGELKVTGKRNKQRIVPFGDELAGELRAYAQNYSGLFGRAVGPVFVDARARRLQNAAVRDIVKRYLSLVTTQRKRSPHVLRHTFATVMLNNGADLKAVKELLGHESLDTTQIYTHTSFAELRKVYAQAHPRSNDE